MWKFNEYDSDNEKAIDSFLHTKNCKLFDKYYSNEFIWQNIREGFKRVKYYSSEYPDRLEIVSYLQLGRYNFAQQAFDISELFQLDNQGAIVFLLKIIEMDCDKPYFTTYFPENIMFVPDNKFALTNIPISPDKADALIARVAKYSYNGKQ